MMAAPSRARTTLRASPATALTPVNLRQRPREAPLPIGDTHPMARARWPLRRLTVIAALAVLGLGVVSVALAQELVIAGTDGDDVLAGTPANDSLYGRAGDDVLLGQAGDDELDGGPGADAISGGPGDDSVSYAGSPVDVTLDGHANDGAAGEGDNDLPDVEDVYGSDGPDIIVGSDAENTIDGNAGGDQITGGRGADGLFGSEGNDQIDSRDGSADRVDCGPGTDSALVDASDIVRDCEKVGRTAVTENFQLAKVLPFGGARATTLRLVNIARGSRVTIACVSRCRPRSSRTQVVARRRSVVPAGATLALSVRLRRSPLGAGATFEIGVKAPRAKPRCRRFVLAAKGGRIDRLLSPRTRCRSIARKG
jgi:hypothetical protein